VDIGIGIARGQYEGFDTIFVAQMFGRPLEETPAPTDSTSDRNGAVSGEETAAPAPAPVEATAIPVMDPVPTPEPAPAPETKAAPESSPSTQLRQGSDGQTGSGNITAAAPAPVVPSQPIELAVVTDPTPPEQPPEPILPDTTAASEPVVRAPTVSITPNQDGYDISAEIDGATAVQAVLGSSSVRLTASGNQENLWEGSIPLASGSVSPGGTPIYLIAVNDAGETVEEVAVAAPEGTPASMYALSEGTPDYRLFGVIPVQGLNDVIRKIFVAVMMLLGGLVLINTLVKFEKQKHGVLAHALVLMLLAGFLAIL
jgi:hypothetical protein